MNDFFNDLLEITQNLRLTKGDKFADAVLAVYCLQVFISLNLKEKENNKLDTNSEIASAGLAIGIQKVGEFSDQEFSEIWNHATMLVKKI